MQGRQHLPFARHIEAWFMASKVSANSWASPISCISFCNSFEAAASDWAAGVRISEFEKTNPFSGCPMSGVAVGRPGTCWKLCAAM